MPGLVLTTSTLPPPGASCLMAANAFAPPARLSDEIWLTALDGSFTVVSTRTSLMPAATAWFSGVWLADTSSGAMSSAAGLADVTDAMIGFCRVASNCVGPWMLTLMLPIFFGLGLDAATHGDVETVAGHALHEGHVVVLAVRAAPTAGRRAARCAAAAGRRALREPPLLLDEHPATTSAAADSHLLISAATARDRFMSFPFACAHPRVERTPRDGSQTARGSRRSSRAEESAFARARTGRNRSSFM